MKTTVKTIKTIVMTMKTIVKTIKTIVKTMKTIVKTIHYNPHEKNPSVNRTYIVRITL